jgi:hypothetical protein
MFFFERRAKLPCPVHENPADHMLDILDEESDADEESENEENEKEDEKEDEKENEKEDETAEDEWGGRTETGGGAAQSQRDCCAQHRGGLALASLFASSPENAALNDMLDSYHHEGAAFPGLPENAAPTSTAATTATATTTTPLISPRPTPLQTTSACCGGRRCCGEISVLTRRLLLVTARDPSVLWIRIGVGIAIGALVGLIFLNEGQVPSSIGARTNVILFVMCCFSLFCLPAIARFFTDRLVFVRERQAGRYGTTAYFFSCMAVEMPLLAAIVVGCVVHAMCLCRSCAPSCLSLSVHLSSSYASSTQAMVCVVAYRNTVVEREGGRRKEECITYISIYEYRSLRRCVY